MLADSGSSGDNSDINATPDSDSDLDSLYGLDKEECSQTIMFDPKNENDPKLELK